MAARLYRADVGIPRLICWDSNRRSYPPVRQSQVGSLTGAVASQRVTEAFKGHLRLVGNQPLSAKA